MAEKEAFGQNMRGAKNEKEKHGLNERQSKVLEFLLAHGKFTIQEFEELCPDVNRRSLQRDLKGLLGKELISK